jgi:hypothetical protein
MNIKTLAIVGSQHWDTQPGILAQFCIASAISFIEPPLVISGGCPKGVDKWVEEEWLERLANDSIPFKPGFQDYPPEIQQWDPTIGKGFKARNIEIATACDALVCIRSAKSLTYGSGWTANYAEMLGKKVWRFEF